MERNIDMIEKLLSISEPWLQYAIRLNLLGENKESLTGLKNEALKDEKIRIYLKDISDFHSKLVSNHSSLFYIFRGEMSITPPFQFIPIEQKQNIKFNIDFNIVKCYIQ
jgi:hypothetical protein